MLKSRLENGENISCFMKELMDSGQTEQFSEEQVCFIAGVMMEAGSDTTRMSLHQFVAGAALWPDWVARARVELDAVCGTNAERLPEFFDRDSLPLIKGAVKETFRWK
jgi:cytochrome P450